MVEKMTKAHLDPDDERALRIISGRPAHELRAHPSRVIDRLHRSGLVTRHPCTLQAPNGRSDTAYEVTITPAGLEALAQEKKG